MITTRAVKIYIIFSLEKWSKIHGQKFAFSRSPNSCNFKCKFRLCRVFVETVRYFTHTHTLYVNVQYACPRNALALYIVSRCCLNCRSILDVSAPRAIYRDNDSFREKVEWPWAVGTLRSLIRQFKTRYIPIRRSIIWNYIGFSEEFLFGGQLLNKITTCNPILA